MPLVRLVRGRVLPIPPSERGDANAQITPAEPVTVRDGSWCNRLIADGDLELAENPRPAPPAKTKTKE